MIDLVMDKLHDTRFLAMIFAAVAAIATVMTLAMPLLSPDNLNKRMKGVAIERDKIRQRERERLARGERVNLRPSPRQYMKRVVDQFNLAKWVGQEEARDKLVQAGYRGHAPYVTYLFFRMVTPIAALVMSLVYMFLIVQFDQPAIVKVGLALGAAYLGMQLPWILLKNKIQRRQLSIKRAFPDALDLLLICVEAGMSVEAAIQKVAGEIGGRSIELAEEMTLLGAELSYLPERRMAYEGLARRVQYSGLKAVMTAMIQAERYGTPLGAALRVMAKENRELRMSAAEKKAAALPAKLTVPMIVFFLPVLFLVILGPAFIKIDAMGLGKAPSGAIAEADNDK